MPPEYVFRGLFSEKLDVFSFGVLLLEIISGRKINSYIDHEQSFSLLGFVSLSKSFLTTTNHFLLIIMKMSSGAAVLYWYLFLF